MKNYQQSHLNAFKIVENTGYCDIAPKNFNKGLRSKIGRGYCSGNEPCGLFVGYGSSDLFETRSAANYNASIGIGVSRPRDKKITSQVSMVDEVYSILQFIKSLGMEIMAKPAIEETHTQKGAEEQPKKARLLQD